MATEKKTAKAEDVQDTKTAKAAKKDEVRAGGHVLTEDAGWVPEGTVVTHPQSQGDEKD